MNRRKFITSTGAAGLLAANGLAAAAPPKVVLAKKALMKVGDQTAPTNETHLRYLARYSVRNICGYPEIAGDRLYATVEELNRMVDLGSKCGISIDCTAPPFLESSYIDKEKHPAIMLAESPERDRDIESLQTMIRNCAQAGGEILLADHVASLGTAKFATDTGAFSLLFERSALSSTVAHPP